MAAWEGENLFVSFKKRGAGPHKLLLPAHARQSRLWEGELLGAGEEEEWDPF